MTTAQQIRSSSALLPRRSRSQIEHLVQLADHLSPPDRELILAYFDRGLSAAAIARLAGDKARRVQYRLRALTDHLRSPEFAFVINHAQQWSQERAKVGELIFLKRLPQQKVADRLNLTTWQVRKHCTAIRTLLEQARTMGRLV